MAMSAHRPDRRTKSSRHFEPSKQGTAGDPIVLDEDDEHVPIADRSSGKRLPQKRVDNIINGVSGDAGFVQARYEHPAAPGASQCLDFSKRAGPLEYEENCTAEESDEGVFEESRSSPMVSYNSMRAAQHSKHVSLRHNPTSVDEEVKGSGVASLSSSNSQSARDAVPERPLKRRRVSSKGMKAVQGPKQAEKHARAIEVRLRAEIEQLKEEKRGALARETERELYIERLEKYKAESAEARKRVRRLETQAREHKKETQRTHAREAEREGYIEELEQAGLDAVEKYKTERMEARERIAMLEDHVKLLTEESQEQKKKIEGKLLWIQGTQRRATQLEVDVAQLKAERDDMEKSMQEAVRIAAELEKKVVVLEANLVRRNARIHKDFATVKKLKEELVLHQQKTGSMAEKNTYLEQLVKDQEEKVIGAKTTIDDLEKSKGDHERTKAKLHEEEERSKRLAENVRKHEEERAQFILEADKLLSIVLAHREHLLRENGELRDSLAQATARYVPGPPRHPPQRIDRYEPHRR